MNSIRSRILILGRDKAEDEQGMAMSTETSSEGDNGYREGGSIKIRSELQTCPSILTLIETKKVVL